MNSDKEMFSNVNFIVWFVDSNHFLSALKRSSLISVNSFSFLVSTFSSLSSKVSIARANSFAINAAVS